MKITVNKCPDTGQLFESDREYRNHRAQLLRTRRAEEKRRRELDSAKRELDELRSQLTDPANLAEWFMTNQARLIELYSLNENRWPSSRFYSTDKFVDINCSLKYRNHISNTHDCPDGGVTNFGWGDRHTNGKPTGYPGWDGRISGKLLRLRQHQGSYPTNDLLAFCKIKTGTGGGGNDGWGYDTRIYLDDWPSLRPVWNDMIQAQMIKAIIDSGPRLSLPMSTC